MKPVIGISAYGAHAVWGSCSVDAVVLHRAYVSALEDVGAAVVLIPPHLDEEAAACLVPRLDGVVIAGGDDIAPDSYGQAAHATTDPPRRDRDATEFVLYRQARELGLPVLGICRGMQLMAVAAGGQLIQDLPSEGYGSLHCESPGEFTWHRARFSEGSLVATALEATELVVNSAHHQAVADAGRLVVTGWAEDGTVEALEDPARPFELGVQWHPELTEDRRLFARLVAAVR